MVIGVGLDLEEFAVLRSVEQPAREAFLARWFSPGEQRWCRGQRDSGRAMTILVACREAVAKAAGLALLDVPPFHISRGRLPGRVTVPTPAGRRDILLRWSATHRAVLASALAFGPGP
ncbi:MAG: 4'-phosphopantetheinyl transferase family protein [Gemmatimonadales bacterium]